MLQVVATKLPPAEVELLKARAAAEDRTVSAVVRRAVRSALAVADDVFEEADWKETYAHENA